MLVMEKGKANMYVGGSGWGQTQVLNRNGALARDRLLSEPLGASAPVAPFLPLPHICRVSRTPSQVRGEQILTAQRLHMSCYHAARVVGRCGTSTLTAICAMMLSSATEPSADCQAFCTLAPSTELAR